MQSAKTGMRLPNFPEKKPRKTHRPRPESQNPAASPFFVGWDRLSQRGNPDHPDFETCCDYRATVWWYNVMFIFGAAGSNGIGASCGVSANPTRRGTEPAHARTG